MPDQKKGSQDVVPDKGQTTPDPNDSGTASQVSPTPQRQPIAKIGDQEFYSTEELVAHVENQASLLGRQGHELGELRKGVQTTPVTPVVQTPQEEDYDTLLWTDPKKAVKRIKDETRQELEVAYQWDQTWTRFFNKYEDLSGELERHVVGIVYNKIYPTVKDKPIDKALEEVAKESRKSIAALAKRQGSVTTTVVSNDDNASVLSGGTLSVPTSTTPSSEGQGIAGYIKQRQEQRKAAQKKQSSK